MPKCSMRWRMSAAERVAAMYRGDLTLYQCLRLGRPLPRAGPNLNGEWWFIAIRTPDVADLDDIRPGPGRV